MAPSDNGGPDIEMDEEGLEYLSKLTEALKNRNKLPYKPRVQGMERQPVPPPSAQQQRPTTPSSEANQRMSSASHDQVRMQSIPLSPSAGTFPTGTILRLEDQTICIYKDIRPNKDYEVVLMLLHDGNVQAQGIALETYDLKSIGQLPPEFVLGIQRRKRWVRDEIIFHLSSYDYCEMVPQIQAQTAADPLRSTRTIQKPNLNPVAEETEKLLVPGREITINFGPNQEWKAIYWGEDDLGTIIAHSTNNKWTLMHMDLKRFKDSMKHGGIVDRTLMDHIHSQVGDK